ncbi:MAG: hypothetical protein H6712_09035 [Myxococcales bacterium]|nr:hypothetical protein [Myxococcales bacterium]MCB9713985.1 hypothetical protein [Myxococcales bacterium]
MSTETSQAVQAVDLHAYFDGELSAEQAEAMAAAVTEHPELELEHEQLGGLQAALRASLEAEARAVPAARFEQIWDEIDRAIERDSRLQAEADRGVSVWSRLWAALRPVRVPLMAAAAAAAVTVIVIGSGPEAPNKSESVASVDEREAPAPEAEAPRAPEPEPTKLADANPGRVSPPPSTPESEIPPMPVPESSDAEIHGIEFGGKNGRIGHTGTVTVLYVEEDDAQSTNSERSL